MLPLFLLIASAVPQDERIHVLDRKNVPRGLVESPAICGAFDRPTCWSEFQEDGVAIELDVNDHGVKAVLIFPGKGYAGSGGDTYFLLQKRKDRWVSVSGGKGWQLYHNLRLRVLDTVRLGYHDLRIGRTLCLKWNGRSYEPFGAGEYRQLPAASFVAGDHEDVELLWLVHHAGEKTMNLRPEWSKLSSEVHFWGEEVQDPIKKITWRCEYKGGVWGVRDDRAFLLVPRTSYLGINDVEVEGNTLLLYGDSFRKPIVSHALLAQYDLDREVLTIGAATEIPYGSN